jgi:hypothetical protein
MHSPHFALICTQEQLKLVNLPGMKQKKKEKVSELIQERILRAWIVRIKVPAAPIGANRDWNSAVAILTSGGNLMAYSLPDLRNCFNYNELVVPTDHKAMQSVSLSANGEVLFLKSDSELERSLISSYGFSYHTTMLPNIFPFEGSTGPAQQPTPPTAPPDPVCEVTVEVTMEQEAENEEKRSRRSQTPSPEEPRPPPPVAGPGTSPKKKKKSSKSKRRSRESKESSVPRPRSPPSGTAISEGAGGGGVNGILASPERNGGTEVSEGRDKALMASATAFKELQKQSRHGSTSEDSSSSDDSSSSSDDEDDIPMPVVPDTSANPVAFQNPYAVELMGGKELDNIIATSLKQLESARDFYEKMQAQVKKS